MFGGIGGALKGLSNKAEEMIEKTKTSVGEMAAEKKAAAQAMLEAQASKTGAALWQTKGAAEGAVVEGVTESKQAAIEGFDQEVGKVEKVVEAGVQETKAAAKPVEGAAEAASTALDPAALLGKLDITGGLGGVQEVEKVVDNAMTEVSTTIDTKMKEADHYIDEKREEVVKTVQEEAQKAASSTNEGILGKARGLLNCTVEH